MKRKAFILFFCAHFSILTALPVSVEEYAEMVGNIDPATHRIPALNNYGSAMCYTTELTEAFLEHCRDQNCSYVLEAGCAYGIKASQIVQTGVFLVANDIDPQHIEIMQNCFARLAKDNPEFNNVSYLTADISDMQPENRKFDAILCESVLHFMRPEAVRKTLNVFNASLHPGGKVYITVVSPFLQGFKEIFETGKAKGMEWPGFLEDPEAVNPVLALFNKPFNAMDEDTLLRELKLAGFKVLKSRYIQKPFLEQELKYDDRDWFIAIAEKE